PIHLLFPYTTPFRSSGKARRYPDEVAPATNNRQIPPDASEKTGSPSAPTNRYGSWAAAPARQPSAAPPNNTTRVCPVTGTGHIGKYHWAARAVSAATPTTRAMVAERDRGTARAVITGAYDMGRLYGKPLPRPWDTILT